MSDSRKDRYSLQQKLGAGAMGEVWLATDTLLNRRAAIKYLKATDNLIHKELFLSEAQLLASLRHPNITLIYDAVFDEKQNQFYLVMEYVEGESLADLIEKWTGSLPLNVILDAAVHVLDALDYAHERGIVHRDIKPENVIFQADEVKLTDFGLAGLVSRLSDGTGYMVGTPAYISPEQILGIATDGRSDLYSLGIMLYEMLSGGHQPFEETGTLSELLEAHLKTPPPSVKPFAPDIPLALDHALQRLLAKEPEGRYPDAAAVRQVIQSIQARQTFNQPHLNLLDPEQTVLVDRANEMKQLVSLWQTCQNEQQPRLAVVQGPIGIGKSRLVAEFLGQHVVDQGSVGLVGRCDEAGTPYAPLAEILATIFNKNLIQSSVTSEQLDQFLNQIPGLGRLLHLSESDKTKEQMVQDPVAAQWRLFASVLALLGELGPTVIFLEDAAYLDEVSLTLVKFVLRQEQLPLLFVAAVRSEAEAVPWLDTLSGDEVEVMTLSPLPMLAIKAYVTHLVDGPVSEAAVTLIKKRSQGIPMQIESITRQLLDAETLHQDDSGVWRYTPPDEADDPFESLLPQTARDAFTRQIKRITPASRELLAPAALLEPGPEFDFSIWLALLGGDSKREAAQAALDEALQKRMLRRVDEGRYAFRPASIDNALAQALPKSRQRELHAQIAELLRGQEGDTVVIGQHYEQAGQSTEAARYLEEAAARAMTANAVQTAITYYGRVTSMVESPSAYLALGTLHRQTGNWTASTEAYQHALNLVDQADIEMQAQILNGLAFTGWLADRYQEAHRHAEAVIKLPGVSRIEQAIARSHLGMVLWLTGRLVEAEGVCRQAVETLSGLQNGGRVEASLASAYNRLGLVSLALGKLDQAEDAAQQALTYRQSLGDQWGQGYCFTNLGNIATERGNFKQALGWFEKARQRFEQVDSQDGLMVTFTGLGQVKLRQGQANEALPLLTKALHLAMQIGKQSAYGLGEIYLLLGQSFLARRDLKRAQAAVADALKLVEAAGNRHYVAQAELLLAQICAAQNDRPAAETHFDQAIALFEQVGQQAGLLRSRLKYGQFLGQNGRTNEASEMVERAQTQAAEMDIYLGG